MSTKGAQGGVGDDIQEGIEKGQREAAPWVERFSRVGYAAKGIVYVTIGLLAASAAFGAGRAEDTSGALRAILQQPFGRTLLIVLGVGLFGYTVWRLAEGIFNVDDKDNDAKGWLKRLGYTASGLAYGGLALEAIQLAMGRVGGSDGQSQETWTARVLSLPFGRWLVLAGALAMAGLAINAVYVAVSGTFRKKLKETEMDDGTRRWAAAIGGTGLVARGLVFAVIAFFLARAGWQYDPQEAGGSAEALAWIADQPFGTWLLTAMGVGLACYGVYAWFQARYRRMQIS